MTQETSQATPAIPSSVRLSMDEDTGTLTAHQDSTDGCEVTAEQIRELMISQGFAHLSAIEKSLTGFIEKSRAGKAEQVIAQIRDASVEIDIDEEDMKVHVQYVPPAGGKVLSPKDVIQQLRELDINELALLPDEIAKMISRAKRGTFLVARGKQETNGKNGYFRWLLEESLQEKTTDEKAVVDFLAGREYLVIDKGTPVLEYLPPTEGTPGYDLKGNVINPKAGTDIKPDKSWEGIEPSFRNPNIYVAGYKGHPVNLNPGARIDKTLVLKGVNLSTGHINFDGSVEIKGDVEAGMKVSATGDINIKGVVERAVIDSGNDIVIQGGVIGQGTNDNNSIAAMHHFDCRINARGHVHLRYVQESEIHAGHSIHIREYSMYSELSAGFSILLGQEGGKGKLIAGYARAGISVAAREIGNSAYTRTSLEVGLREYHQFKIQKLQQEKSASQMKAKKLIAKLEELKISAQVQKELAKTSIKQAHQVKSVINEIRAKIQELNSEIKDILEIDQIEEHHIEARKFFPNVHILLDGVSTEIDNEQNNAKLILNEGEIVPFQ